MIPPAGVPWVAGEGYLFEVEREAADRRAMHDLVAARDRRMAEPLPTRIGPVFASRYTRHCPRCSLLVRPHGAERSAALAVLVFLTAIYGGYFGAAQSVLLMAFLAVFVPDELQRLNGLKNLLTPVVNGIAAAVFCLVAPVDWRVVVLIGAGAIIGGQLGALVGRRMSPLALRSAVVVVGFVVAARLLLA